MRVVTTGSRSTADLNERTAFFDSAAQFTPYLATAAGEALFLVKTEDQHIGRSLFGKQGRGELTVLARAVGAIKGLLGQDAIAHRAFVDVGANIGTTTVPALLTHGFGSAVAVEPEPENLRVLRLNMLLNGVEDQVKVLPAAVSDEVGQSNLVVDHSRGGKHWIVTDDGTRKPKDASPTILQVESVTLDHLVETGTIDPGATGMLWMDAEAHEGHILRGASSLLTRGVPLVLEWNPGNLVRQGDLEMILKAVGENYTHFTDMHRNPDPGRPRFSLQTIEQLEAYGQKFLDPEVPTNAKTDLLVIRLESERGRDVEDLGLFVKEQSEVPWETPQPVNGGAGGASSVDASIEMPPRREKSASTKKQRARAKRAATGRADTEKLATERAAGRKPEEAASGKAAPRRKKRRTARPGGQAKKRRQKRQGEDA